MNNMAQQRRLKLLFYFFLFLIYFIGSLFFMAFIYKENPLCITAKRTPQIVETCQLNS